MKNTPVSIGDLPAAAGSGRTQTGPGGSGILFGGLFDAARVTAQGVANAQPVANAQSVATVKNGATEQPVSTAQDIARAHLVARNQAPYAESSPQGGAASPAASAADAHPVANDGFEVSGSEAAAPVTTEFFEERPAIADAVVAAAGNIPAIELDQLDITAELSLAYPNMPVAAGGSLRTNGSSPPIPGAGLPATGTTMPTTGAALSVPEVGMPVAQAAPANLIPAGSESLPAGLATAAPSPAELPSAGSPVAGSIAPALSRAAESLAVPGSLPLTTEGAVVLKAAVDAAGLPATPARDVATQVVSTEVTSTVAVKADRTETTFATAPRPALAELVADGTRSAPTSPQQPDTRSLRAPGSFDPAEVYTRAGRVRGALQSGAAMRSGLAPDGGPNPRTLLPLQAAFASAPVRPAAPRPGSSAMAGADSGAEPLSAALDATAADASAQRSPGSISSPARLAEGLLRGEFTRTDPVLGAQVSAQIARQIQQGMGSSTLHIKLNPSELGQVDVQLRMDGDRVHVAITTHQSATRDLIESHLSSLRSALENGGLALGDVDVRQSSQGGPQGGAQGERELHARDSADQRPGRGGLADVPEDTISRGLATEGSSGRSIDAFV